MGMQVDSIPAGLTQADAGSAGMTDDAMRRQNLGIDAVVAQFAKGIPLSGLNAVIKTAKFTHGVPTILQTPFVAKGAVVMGVEGAHTHTAVKLSGTSTPGQSKATLYFADATATNITASLLLTPEGTVGTNPGVVSTGNRAFASAGSGSPSIAAITSASGWTDVTGCSMTWTPYGGRQILVAWTITGYGTVNTGGMQTRLVLDGSATAAVYSFFYNTLNQHQAWPFQYVFNAEGLGTAGTAHTVKVQVQVVGGGGCAFSMDTNDSASVTAQEVG